MNSMRRPDQRDTEQRSGRAGRRPVPMHDYSPFTAAALNMFVADTAVLLAKTLACHRNARGAGADALRALTALQCAELFAAMNILAERMQASASPVSQGLARILELSMLEPELGRSETAAATGVLADDNTTMARHARDTAEEMEQGDDPASRHALVARIAIHERAAWLLRCQLPTLPSLEAGALS